MLRSRMLTPGFKLFFGLAIFLFMGALLFGASSTLQTTDNSVKENLDVNGPIQTITGPLTLGWKGGVGNHFGYTVLLGGAVIAGFIAFTLIAFRDADPEAEAEAVQVDTVPLTRAPAGANFAPLVAAFSVAVILIGWVVNTTMVYAGLVLLVATVGTWTIRAWAERATGDDQVNVQIYHRLIDPLRVPLVAAAAVGFVVFGLSRLILAAPDKNTSSIIFGGAALIFFGGVIAVYLMPKIARPLSMALLIVAGLAVLGGGIYGLVQGERPVVHEVDGGGHVTEGTGGSTEGPGGSNTVPEKETPPVSEQGLAPVGVEVTVS